MAPSLRPMIRPISEFVSPSTYFKVIKRCRSGASAAVAVRTRSVSSCASSVDSGPGTSDGIARASSRCVVGGRRPRSRNQFASRL